MTEWSGACVARHLHTGETVNLDGVQRIAVLRALQLGDMLVAVPSLRALRQRFPHAEITLIGLPWAAAFVRRYQHYLDRFVEFQGYPGIVEVEVDQARVQRFIDEQRQYHYDLVVQLHGSGQASNPLVAALRPEITVGSYLGEPPETLTLGMPYASDRHEIVRNLNVVGLLGATVLDTRMEFPLYEEDHTEAAHLLLGLGQADRPWIALHPGARPPSRRWPANYFAQVGDRLARRYAARIIITGGPGEEATVTAVCAQMHHTALNLAGQTSLGGLAALIGKMDLFISNDTGPAHIAHALAQPSITIFGPADYARWAPLDQERHPALRRAVHCSPCGYWSCPIDHRCLHWLSPVTVLQAADRLLARNDITHVQSQQAELTRPLLLSE